jgi:superfamily II DNA or RNA helicase
MTTTEVTPAPQALRPYQQDIVSAVYKGLRDGGLGQIRMACGSGKTLVGLRAAELLVPEGGTVAVLTPSLALIAQTLAVWVRNAERPLEALAVCGDETVTDAAVSAEDIPVPVTTSSKEIAAWLRRPPGAGMRLVLCTHLSGRRLAEAVAATGPADLVILDEAHHYAGRMDFPTRQILRPERLPCHRRLAMTATPREDLRMVQDNVDGGTVPMVGMDDHSVFGPVLGDYPFARGIAEGYLKDYRILVIGIRDSETRAMLAQREIDYTDSPGGPSLQTVVAQTALSRTREQFGIKRVLTFHPRVETAAEFSRTLAATLSIAAPGQQNGLYRAHVHGGMEQRLRERIIDRLRDVAGGWSVISNARCLGEGVDVPAVDAVLFAHPKRSAVDISQAVGRALRRAPETSGPAVIIVPLIVPEEGGEVGDLEPGDYATLWHVVRALRAHDESLGTALDAQRQKDSISNPHLPDKITVVLPPGTSSRFLTDLQLLLVRQTTSVWWEGYHAARAYHAEHGHLQVPAGFRTDTGIRLGHWIAQRRHERRRGLLSRERTEALDALGMLWDLYGDAFTGKLQAAVEYHAGHGHLLVPPDYVTADGTRLGAWINKQRNKYRQGQLSAEQVEALNKIDMIWYVNRPAQAWAAGIEAARRYHQEHGRLTPRKEYRTEGGYPLGAWVGTQRLKYRKGELPAARVTALEELGMVWNTDEAAWQHAYSRAKAYHDTHGHLDVPHSYVTPDGTKLGSWLLHQRQLRSGVKPGGISAARVKDLDALGMRWDSHRRPPRRTA